MKSLQHEGLILGGLRPASEEPFFERLGTHNLPRRFDQFHAQRSTDVAPGQLVDDYHGASACDLERLDNGEFVCHCSCPLFVQQALHSRFTRLPDVPNCSPLAGRRFKAVTPIVTPPTRGSSADYSMTGPNAIIVTTLVTLLPENAVLSSCSTKVTAASRPI